MTNWTDVKKPSLAILKIDHTGQIRLPDRWQIDAVSGMSDKIGACGSKRLVAAVALPANPVWFVS